MNDAKAFADFARPSRKRQPTVSAVRIAGCRLWLEPRHRAGLGLVEVICATLIVGIMLVAALETVGAVFRTQRLNADRLTGPNLAMELMTEVLSQPYEDPEPATASADIGRDEDEASTPRKGFDDVDDYDGWNESGVQNNAGIPNADFSTWRRQIEVAWADPSTGDVADADTGLKRITVTVTSPSPDEEETVLTSYRAKDGMLEQSPATEMTIVTWLGAKLQLGFDENSEERVAASVGTNLTNHATDTE